MLSHRSAAALWGIRPATAAAVDVTALRRRGYTSKLITVHRSTTLEEIDIDTVAGIPVTGPARTIVDLAALVSPGSLEYAIHRAEAQRKVTSRELEEILLRMFGKRGTAAVRALVAAPHHELDARTRSPWERRFLAICRAYGIPEPRVNRWIALENAAGGAEVDFSWPDRRLVVEVDENASHRTIRARRNDCERDLALRRAGWRVLRVGEDEFPRPATIAASVHAALGAGRRRSN